MMVGIMSILETATSFDQSQLRWSAVDAERPSSFASVDRVAYLAATTTERALLQSATPPTCLMLPSMLKLVSYVNADPSSPSSFRCVFQRVEEASSRVWMHRILIDKNGDYWSCVYDQAKANSCPFE